MTDGNMDEKKDFACAAVLTCHNRREKTLACLRSLAEGNPRIGFTFIVTDDGSTDGTPEALLALPYTIVLLRGDGTLFWNGGMRSGMAYLRAGKEAVSDYVLMVNDDVRFYEGAIEALIVRSAENGNCTVAGATEDTKGRLTYGGVRCLSATFARFSLLPPSQEPADCDTFNGNCVLLPWAVFLSAGELDPRYLHSMADYDYGLGLKRQGFRVINAESVSGVCEDNDIRGSWRDRTLSRAKRLQKKESPKGLPRGDWFYFLKKNYGLFSALYHSLTPYLRIAFRL